MNIALNPQQLAQHSDSHWLASINLNFARRSQGTIIEHVSHQGPLRIQRPFYPEGCECCHVYLLHPPGGLVAGDQLSINISADETAHALLTTPSAGKVYRSNKKQQQQRQLVKIQLRDQALIEWLPMETIVFNGATAVLDTRVWLESTSQVIGWDFLCFGRPACGEIFDKGYVKQNLEIWRENKPLLCDRSRFIGGEEIFTASWGMRNQPVYGLFYSTLLLDDDSLNELQNRYATCTTGQVGITQRNGVLIARFIGQSAEDGKVIFSALWAVIRNKVLGRAACRPRIWNT